MAPNITAPVSAESATRTAGVVTVTAVAFTGSNSVAVAKVIAAKNFTFATATATAGKCAGGKPGASENKDNCKNNYGAARH
jgi:hypothetical protein